MRRLVLGLLPLLVPGSVLASGLVPLTFIEETEHFRFVSGPSTGGRLKVDAKASEKAYRELSALLGVTLEGKIEYQRLEFPEQVAVYSGDSNLWTTGVAHPESRVIQSTLPSHPHEVVHVLSNRLGQPSTFFVEGLAVELGDRGKLGESSVDSVARPFVTGPLVDRSIASFRDVDPLAAYSLAGSFTRYLVRRYGLPRLLEFFGASHHGGLDEANVFHRTFGVALSEALSGWREGLR
jgi:hypothetical protein